MLMDIECGRGPRKDQSKKEKQPKKKIKHNERLITRLILTLGLAGTIACVGSSVYTYGKTCEESNKYWDLDKQKTAYLDTFETSSIFQDSYTTSVSTLKDRLINGMISGSDYDKEMEKLNSNDYTQQVLLDNADTKTKNEFNEINEAYLQTSKALNKTIFPHLISVFGTAFVPFMTLGAYSITRSTDKYKIQMQTLVEEEKLNAKTMAENTIKQITGKDVDLDTIINNEENQNSL